MTIKFITGALAIGLVAATAAEKTEAEAAKPAADAAEATKPAAEATTPPIEVKEETPAPKLDPEQIKEGSSYALGFRSGSDFARNFGRFGVGADDINSEIFMKGFMAALKDGKPGMEEENLQAAMEAFRLQLEAREKELAEANKIAGEKFLAENGKKEGVITTQSGLQYQIINKGGDEKYAAPKDGEQDNKQFLVNYKGTLINGKQFDASPEGQPVPMTLQVVDGFKEALTTMPVGAKWKLFLPSELAYGPARQSADLGPNTLLIFELELVKIEDAPPQQGGMPFPMPQGQ